MKKKRILFGGILLLIGTLIFIFYQGKTVSVYIGSMGDTDKYGVDIMLKINNVIVWENNIHSGLNNYTELRERFKFGYNTIEVISKNKNLLLKKVVFVSINEHIVIEYIPPSASSVGKKGVSIEIRSGKFYYE